uniref:ORF3 n=1 Tax=Andrena associated bee virus-1 TaxID=2811531 RepID=A0A897ZFF2_9VIRU|nr:ORF3 [Andrena associated bee virus-1]
MVSVNHSHSPLHPPIVFYNSPAQPEQVRALLTRYTHTYNIHTKLSYRIINPYFSPRSIFFHPSKQYKNILLHCLQSSLHQDL